MKPMDTIRKMIEGKPVTIAALGDSLTYGWLVNKGYLNFLEEMLTEKYPDCKLTIINKGIPGDTAFGGLNRLEKDILIHNPDAVFIQFALNDAFSGYSADEFSANIQEIINRIKSSMKADIILVKSIYLEYTGADIAGIFYNTLDEIAEKNKIPIARVDEYWQRNIKNKSDFRKFVQNDFMHPNEAGYRMMAEAIMDLF